MAELVLLLGAATIGLVVGVVIVLVKYYKPFSFPVPKKGKKEGWKQLKRLCKERAKVKSKRDALKDSYKAKKVDESTYVSRDSKYEHKLDALDAEINKLVKELSEEFLPERLSEEAKKFKEMTDLVNLRRKAQELSKEKNKLENKLDSLSVELDETESMEEEATERAKKLEKQLEKERKKKKELESNIEDLKNTIEGFKEEKEQGGKKRKAKRLENLRKENKILRERIDRVKKRQDNTSKQLKVLEVLMDRYDQELADKESKTASELKSLIKPKSETVKDLVKAHDSPRKSFEFVRDEVEEINPNIEIWLSPDDIDTIRAADHEDRAILLCSMLKAMGEDAKVIVIELMNGMERALVLFTKDSWDYLLDLEEIREFSDYKGKKEELLKEYSYKKSPVKEVLYEFNDKKYEAS